MPTHDYDVIPGQCHVCRTEEDVVMDEDGDMICTDCLFEKTCEDMFKTFGGSEYEEQDDDY